MREGRVEFMEEWKEYLFDDIINIIDYRGRTPLKSEFGIITLSAKSVKTNFIDYSKAYYISQETYDKFMVRGYPKIGDILMTTEAPLGCVARLDREDVAIAQRLLILQGKTNILNNEYLLYFLQSHIGQHKLNERATGTTVIGIKQKEFRKISINLPSLPEQKAIAKTLSCLDEKIELNQNMNKTLEEMAQAIFNDYADDDFIELSQCIKIKHGFAFKGEFITTIKNENILVTPGNFCIGGGFKESKYKYYIGEIPNDYILKDNDLIITMTDLSKEGDTLGYGAIVPMSINHNYLHNQRIGLVQEISNILPKTYIYWFLRSKSYQKNIVSSATGSTVKHTSPKRILEQKIPLIKNNNNDLVDNIFNNINTKIQYNNLEIEKLKNIRDTLLPKLMSGEVRVPFGAVE